MTYPILFKGEMIRAILDGRKTQTRRVLSEIDCSGYADDPEDTLLYCPYGVPGCELWVRETWAIHKRYDHLAPRDVPMHAREGLIWCRATCAPGGPPTFSHGNAKSPQRGRWRPSIHMPRWACRLMLRLTEVRVERVWGITNADAIAEGTTHRHHFAALWDSINAKRGYGWETDPWVWVLSFEVLPPKEMA